MTGTRDPAISGGLALRSARPRSDASIEQPRPAAVDALIEIMTDDGLTGEGKIDLVERSGANDAEELAAAQVFGRAAVFELVEARLLHQVSGSVLDLSVRQVQALAVAYGVIARWDGRCCPAPATVDRQSREDHAAG